MWWLSNLLLRDLKSWSIPQLDRETERKLLYKAKAGCIESRDLLIRSLVLFAINRAKGRWGMDLEFADYVQYCILGIIAGIKKYNMKYKVRLISYVGWTMRREIAKGRFHGELIHTPAGSEPKTLVPIELAYPICTTTEPKEHDLWFMQYLNERERVVVENHFFNGKTFSQIGKMINRSKERIRQIQYDVFKRIRDAEERATTTTERARIFMATRRSRGCSKKPRKNHVLSAAEQVAKCFANRGN